MSIPATHLVIVTLKLKFVLSFFLIFGIDLTSFGRAAPKTQFKEITLLDYKGVSGQRQCLQCFLTQQRQLQNRRVLKSCSFQILAKAKNISEYFLGRCLQQIEVKNFDDIHGRRETFDANRARVRPVIHWLEFRLIPLIIRPFPDNFRVWFLRR